MRGYMDKNPETKIFEFDFYSMMFDTFELHPKEFYNFELNHYFNQMSLFFWYIISLATGYLISNPKQQYVQTS